MLDHFIFKDSASAHCRNIKTFREPIRDLLYFKDVNPCKWTCGTIIAFNIKVTSGDQLGLNYVSGTSQLRLFLNFSKTCSDLRKFHNFSASGKRHLLISWLFKVFPWTQESLNVAPRDRGLKKGQSYKWTVVRRSRKRGSSNSSRNKCYGSVWKWLKCFSHNAASEW